MKNLDRRLLSVIGLVVVLLLLIVSGRLVSLGEITGSMAHEFQQSAGG